MTPRSRFAREGVPQRRLRRVAVHWGAQVRQHLAVVPLFDGGYKVLGMVGLDAEEPPTWYPGVPLVVEPGRLVFRSSLREAPPAWSEVPEDLLAGCYLLDNWGAVQSLVPREPGAPDLTGAVNLAGGRIRGRQVQDVVYEPPLHRVRALALSGRWGRSRTVSVLQLPALAECLQPAKVPQLDAEALGPPPPRPESWMERALRVLFMPLQPRPGRRR